MTFGMLYLPQRERQNHALHLRNDFLIYISKNSTLHLVPVHCVLGQISVNVDLVVAIDYTCYRPQAVRYECNVFNVMDVNFCICNVRVLNL